MARPRAPRTALHRTPPRRGFFMSFAPRVKPRFGGKRVFIA